jgi:CubicO group peptidase (beta-lactamase class C family)
MADSEGRATPAAPDDRGFAAERLERVQALCREAVACGEIPGLALAVARGEKLLLNEAWGRAGPSAEAPARPETVWLIASITKPVVCAGLCLLWERGELLLDDPVSRFLPEYDGADRRETTLFHLLTHSSGLPDMLPENVELRRAHAPLSEFVARACRTPLLFPPGAAVSYQSAGIALAAAVIERVAGLPCREFLRREFFQPLGMESCALGWRPEFAGRAAECILEGGQAPSDWDWNSRYWREFGAPWGGMFATAAELARFMQMLLHGGASSGRRFFGRRTVERMTADHTLALLGPEAARQAPSRWGLGWRLPGGSERGWLPDLASAGAYGHIGATGTAAWNEPEQGLSFVFFSSQPDAQRWARRTGNGVLAG